jgi:hypothetical protein
MCVIICCVNYIPVYCACFGGSPSEEATKIDSSKKFKTLIPNEYKGPCVGPRAGPEPHIFIG